MKHHLLPSIWLSFLVLVGGNFVHIDYSTSNVGQELCKHILESSYIIYIPPNIYFYPLLLI